MNLKKMLSTIKENYFSSDMVDYSKCNSKTANLFVTLALIFGILLIFLNPPMLCPDENAHYMNICRITGGSIFVDIQDNTVGSWITQDQAEFINNYNGRYAGLDAEKYTFKDAYHLSHLNFTGDQYIFFGSSLSTINPAAYIIPSIGVNIGKALFPSSLASPYNLLICAKITNLLFYIIVTCIAITKTPVFKNTMFLIALMPMTIYQCSSISYDAILIPSSFMFFAYAAKLITATNDYRVTIEDIVAICFSCSFIFAAKIAYAPLVLILLAVNIKKFGNIKKYIMCIALVMACGVVFYLIPTSITNYFTATANDISLSNPLIAEQSEYLKSHIPDFMEVLVNTTIQTYPFWINGFFGILGSLDINFPQPFIYLYLLTIAVTAIFEMSLIERVNFTSRVLSFLGILIFYAGSAVAMYVSWTPLVTGEIGGEYFTGIQGRYFIPIALFSVFILSNPFLKKFKFSNVIFLTQNAIIKYISVSYLSLMCLIMLTKVWI